MADEPDQEQESSAPNLEPPKLFGRRKRKTKPAPTPEPVATTEPAPAPEPEPTPPPEPAPEPGPEPAPEPAPEPVEAAPADRFEPPGPSAPQESPVVEEEPTAVYDATDPTADIAPVATAVPPAAATDSDTDTGTGTGTGTGTDTEDDTEDATAPPERTRERRPRVPRGDREPVASPRNGSVITGVVAGALLIGLVFAGFQGCEAARGSNSCGTTPGILLLLVVLAITIVVGGLLLSYFRVPDPVSTSFLAVALVGVVALLVLVDVLDTWPMLVVIPLLSAAAFLASWWITTTFVEPQS